MFAHENWQKEYNLYSQQKEYNFYVRYEREVLGIKDAWSRYGTRLGQISLLAILIVASLGVANILPATQMGWSVAGLGAGYMAFKLFAGQEKKITVDQIYKKRTFDLLTSALIASALIAIGTLGGLNILSYVPCSAALIGVVVLTAIAFSTDACCSNDQKRARDHFRKNSHSELETTIPTEADLFEALKSEGNAFPEVPQ